MRLITIGTGCAPSDPSDNRQALINEVYLRAYQVAAVGFTKYGDASEWDPLVELLARKVIEPLEEVSPG